MKILSRNKYLDVKRLLAAPKAIYEKAYMKMESVRDAYFATKSSRSIKQFVHYA